MADTMTFAEYEIAPARTLSAAQERRLNRKYCTGDFGGGSYSTIVSLIRLGYVRSEDGGKRLVLTESAQHYLSHYGSQMPI